MIVYFFIAIQYLFKSGYLPVLFLTLSLPLPNTYFLYSSNQQVIYSTVDFLQTETDSNKDCS